MSETQQTSPSWIQSRRRLVGDRHAQAAAGIETLRRGLLGVPATQPPTLRLFGLSRGTSRIAPRGSFTLITGVLGREPILTGSAAALANGAVESFVLAAALEITPQRVNAVSPTVFTESLDHYGDVFPGYPPVDLAEVARAYVRSVEGAETGRIFRLPG